MKLLFSAITSFILILLFGGLDQIALLKLAGSFTLCAIIGFAIGWLSGGPFIHRRP